MDSINKFIVVLRTVNDDVDVWRDDICKILDGLGEMKNSYSRLTSFEGALLMLHGLVKIAEPISRCYRRIQNYINIYT